eukprot:SAG11_NODE_28207_length_324_cov_0.915556_1_plen_25_part_01
MAWKIDSRSAVLVLIPVPSGTGFTL